MAGNNQPTPSAIEAAKAHFLESAPQPFDVPEWGIRIFPKRENMADLIRRFVICGDKGFDRANQLAYTLISLACKEDGSKHFSPADRTALVNDVDPDVLESVVLRCTGISAEAAEKNF